MFGLLKKKITSFIDNLTKKEEEKPEEPQAESQPKHITPEIKTPPTAHVQTPPAEPKTQPPTPAQAAEPKTATIQTPPLQPPQVATQVEPVPLSVTKPQTPAPASAVKPRDFASTIKDALFPSTPKPSQPTPKPLPTTQNRTETQHVPTAQTTHPAENATPTAKALPFQSQPRADAPLPTKTIETAPASPIASISKPEAKPSAAIPKPAAAIPPITKTDTNTSETIPKPSVFEQPKERKLEAKIGILSQIKGLITREVQIQPNELEPMLEELNMALLESDVTLDTAEHIVSTIKTQLSGKKVEKSRVQAEIQAAVKTALVEVLDKPGLDLIDYIKSHDKPVKILFLGPNGAGKTTTLAKIAYYLKENDVRCVLAAADTFRAAAIEQLQHHGAAIGVPVIKHQYGADPAAVAFDAIAHAKAHGLDVVLIDTAGRQETNYNLLKEMEKVNRVVKPDLKLFIGEAVAGHALVEQAKTFHQALKLDGVVLTKVDCDAKGGTSFSVSHEVGVPIVLLGTGQNYGDIRTFDAKWLVSNVLAE